MLDFIISEKYKVVFTVSTGIIHATKLLKYYDEYRKIAVFSLKQAKSMGGNGVYFFEKEDYKLFLKKEKIKVGDSWCFFTGSFMCSSGRCSASSFIRR